ncbi:Protein of unknown function [Gryllus bimaculatus]|nr:Protein of unknown function [Gryllus bimaculatus]
MMRHMVRYMSYDNQWFLEFKSRKFFKSWLGILLVTMGTGKYRMNVSRIDVIHLIESCMTWFVEPRGPNQYPVRWHFGIRAERVAAAASGDFRCVAGGAAGNPTPSASTTTCCPTTTSWCGREPQEPDHDDEPVGGTVLVRLQAALGAPRVWRRAHVARAFGPHLAAGHRALQQVSAAPRSEGCARTGGYGGGRGGGRACRAGGTARSIYNRPFRIPSFFTAPNYFRQMKCHIPQ